MEFRENYKYDYPDRLNLRPGSELHEKIVSEIMTRATESSGIMSRRYPSWKKIDEVLTAYISTDAKESVVTAKDSRKPVSIVIPQTYATMEILLTYLTASLLEDPIFRYEARSPEDILGAILLEKLISHQCYYTKAPLALHTMLRDGLAYNMGLVAPEWIQEYALVSRPVQRAPSMFDRLLGRAPEMEKSTMEELVFEGNRLQNIDPYLFLPDVNVPINRLQDGEYMGWVSRDNFMGLLKEEKTNEDMFNVKYVVKIGDGKSRLFKTDQSGRGTKTGMTDYITTASVAGICDVIWMFIDLIPKEWKLPGGMNNRKGDYPETWLFAVAADTVVVMAKPLGLNHGRKPVVAFAPDFDGYSISNISRMEILNGMQTVLDFMFNSHVVNVRKAINDMLIVDPSLINMKDLENPSPGKLIKMNRSAWGRGIENAVKQLKVEDITRNNIADASIIIDLMKAVSGSVDAVSGLRRKTSERVTAEEVKGDRFGGLSRLEKLAKVCSWMALQDLGYMLASQTQQLMSQDTYVKTVGEWQDVLVQEYEITDPRKLVTPMDILIPYDAIVRDGSVPGGNFADIWVQMLPQILQPGGEISARMDGVRILKHIMRSLGAKDVNQFDRKQIPQQQAGPPVQADVQPDEDVMRQVEAGNVIPIGGRA